MTKILEMVHVHKTFRQDLLKPTRKVLIDVSCSFEQGHATAILGHNGAGKTTSIRTILGLIKPDSGQILFNGHEIVNEDRRKIGYMPETNKIPGELRAKELLSFHLNLYHSEWSAQIKKERIEKKLEEVGLLEKHANKRIAYLSKGLGRRLAWAMASIHEPELLILDEPFTGMDPLGRKDLSRWIEHKVSSGSSVIMTTHELDSAKELCSKFVIFREGHVVYEGDSSLQETQILSYFEGVL